MVFLALMVDESNTRHGQQSTSRGRNYQDRAAARQATSQGAQTQRENKLPSPGARFLAPWLAWFPVGSLLAFSRSLDFLDFL